MLLSNVKFKWKIFQILFSRVSKLYLPFFLFSIFFICLLFPIFYFDLFFKFSFMFCFKFCSFLYYSAENPNWHTESDGRWFTSRVISRIKSNLVQTKGGPYCLEGKMNFQLAFSYGTPQFILSAFKSGFPENWDMYREQWRKFTKQQRGMNIFFINCWQYQLKPSKKLQLQIESSELFSRFFFLRYLIISFRF